MMLGFDTSRSCCINKETSKRKKENGRAEEEAQLEAYLH